MANYTNQGYNSLEKARKYTKVSFCRLRPNYEKASYYYREAIKYFMLDNNKNYPILCLYYKECSIAHEQSNLLYTAAEYMEKAAKMELNNIELFDKKIIIDDFCEAGRLYHLNDSVIKASKNYINAAKLSNNLDIYWQSCVIFEINNKNILFSRDAFTIAIKYSINNNFYEFAIKLLEHQKEHYLNEINLFQLDYNINNICIILLYLIENNITSAKQIIYDENDGWNSSKEYSFCQDLIYAFQNKNIEELDNIKNIYFFKSMYSIINSLLDKITALSFDF
jgi:hypothetical protein